MKYRLHPEARRDLRDAARFYEDQAGAALAQQFLAEFDRSIALLLEYPYLGGAWLYGKRRLRMQRFRYHIVYGIEHDEVRVMAVAHDSRRPDFWRHRE